MKYIALIAGFVALAGCNTQPIETMNYSQQKQLAVQILDRCHKQGVKPGTQEEKDCFYIETRAEAYNRRANVDRRRALGQALAVASQPAGPPPPMMQPMGPQQVVIQPNTGNALTNYNNAYLRSRRY